MKTTLNKALVVKAVRKQAGNNPANTQQAGNNPADTQHESSHDEDDDNDDNDDDDEEEEEEDFNSDYPDGLPHANGDGEVHEKVNQQEYDDSNDDEYSDGSSTYDDDDFSEADIQDMVKHQLREIYDEKQLRNLQEQTSLKRSETTPPPEERPKKDRIQLRNNQELHQQLILQPLLHHPEDRI